MKYFVYIQGLRGPEAQKWDGEQTVNQKPVPTLMKREISDWDWDRPLNMLKEIYPYVEPSTLGDKNA